jgi:asparagine synthase (glutamine-hydrolysing)
MCGICGLVRPLTQQSCPFPLSPESQAAREELPAKSQLESMLAALHHRGPDARGAWTSAMGAWQLMLGHTRLAILDRSELAHQPMTDPNSGCVLTYNGELYNFVELRARLWQAEGIPFSSTGDTEVLLRAYLHWGKSCVTRLRGMFAFAIYDPHQQELFLARDHFGIKPLYLTQGVNGYFAFASEVRALLTLPWVERNLDPLGLMGYLAYGSVQDPQTLISNVHALPAGHTLTINLSKNKLVVDSPRTFWQMPKIPTAKNGSWPALSLKETTRQVRQILTESVRYHLVSDVPVSVFLSSGLDSGTVLALMAEIAPSQVQSVTVAFNEATFDESETARVIAGHYGTQHTEIRLTAADFLQDLPSWLASQDQPSTDGANTWVISRVCREAGLKVALSGLGGDELFAGYPTFRRTAQATRLFKGISWLPPAMRHGLAHIIGKLGNGSIMHQKLVEWLRSDGSTLSTYLILRRMFLPVACQQLLAPSLTDLSRDTALHFSILEKLRRQSAGPDTIAAVSLLEMSTYLVNTLLRDNDQMGMAHSLEIRVPFIDVKVVEAILSIPGATRLAGKGLKPLLRAAMQDKLKSDRVDHSKMGFVFPFDHWLRGPLRTEVEQGLITLAGFPFRPGAVQTLWRQFLRNDKRVNAGRILTLYALASWLQRHQCESFLTDAGEHIAVSWEPTKLIMC